MTEHTMQQSIHECLQQWLGSLGLYGFDSSESQDQPLQQCATVQIEGSIRWNIEVRATKALLHRVALEMTGMSKKKLDAELLDDVLREFANTMGGNLYPILEGAKSMRVPRSEPATGRINASVCLTSGDMTAQVTLLNETTLNDR